MKRVQEQIPVSRQKWADDYLKWYLNQNKKNSDEKKGGDSQSDN